ncbi:M3 family metallopeptidase [Streptomyces sp. TP-A0874]|uniref:M3 family metallopeptidase n=1 Tax=Streptomyces sp. TP-A0874 TaxID=549819 RepID=UPI0008535309|nr:M3 family metallopeptidase [Streptomyces sp. TP-A0874]
MKERLDAIVAEDRLTQAAFVELAAIYDNAAYVFLYLESNEQHVDYRALLPYRTAFFKNDVLDGRLRALCAQLNCEDPELEECRRAYVAHLDGKLTADPGRAEELEKLQEHVKEIARAGDRDQLALLGRLGLDISSGSARSIAYSVISATGDASRRAKLAGAMTTLRDKRLGALLETTDRMVAVRREDSRHRGFATPLDETMRRCSLSVEAARGLVDDYLVGAIEEHRALEAEIREVVGEVAAPMDHFGHYLRKLQGDLPVPLFDLQDCLGFVRRVAERVFGLTMSQLPDNGSQVLTVVVSRGEQVVGYINFDLWDAGRNRAANSTSGIRNRVDWGDIVQLPIAYVSCRFHRQPDGRDRITFQNVHSLFHETGHALNHLLVSKRLPTVSGLDYLPLERIEDLSMWHERWVYHPDFVDHLDLSADERAGMEFCQRAKILEYQRTHVERAVTAALDFGVHGAEEGGLRAEFDRLDERFDISRYCSLGDYPVYFSWPMINANPGASFVYTRSAAASAEAFAPVLGRRLDDLDPAEFEGRFAACFDYDLPSGTPDIRSIFTSYRDLLGKPIS